MVATIVETATAAKRRDASPAREDIDLPITTTVAAAGATATYSTRPATRNANQIGTSPGWNRSKVPERAPSQSNGPSPRATEAPNGASVTTTANATEGVNRRRYGPRSARGPVNA